MLGINNDSDEGGSFKETFSLAQAPDPVIFHSASLQDLDAEPEEEMIRIVNTNKHVFNEQDGGRRRKFRHVSKIQTFKRGHDAIKPFCKDLFDVKKDKGETSEHSEWIQEPSAYDEEES